ncbi:hypothetical protein [Cyclobacterium salsum]|uniref:hypothetical protein n=1 Tax=Cyclobacterium salsum TaxID=2666329 RepID=UPI0013917406|nr:hypothetical protein [Cyclobacterium salsum]
MIRHLRNTGFLKGLWAFMAVYMLNCSVDIADERGDHIPEDLSINDQESIIELVVELGFGMEDAIPEKEDADGDQDTSQKKGISTDLMLFIDCPYNRVGRFTVDTTNFLPSTLGWVSAGFFAISTPPPDIS